MGDLFWFVICVAELILLCFCSHWYVSDTRKLYGMISDADSATTRLTGLVKTRDQTVRNLEEKIGRCKSKFERIMSIMNESSDDFILDNNAKGYESMPIPRETQAAVSKMMRDAGLIK